MDSVISQEEFDTLYKKCSTCKTFHLTKCPYCGDEITPKEIEKKLLEGASMEEVKAYRLKNLPAHLRRPFKELSKNELYDYARHLGYSPKWVYVILKTTGRK